jgi:hypothetical protein
MVTLNTNGMSDFGKLPKWSRSIICRLQEFLDQTDVKHLFGFHRGFESLPGVSLYASLHAFQSMHLFSTDVKLFLYLGIHFRKRNFKNTFNISNITEIKVSVKM